MFPILPAIDADTASAPKDAEASEEDNPADSDDDGGGSEFSGYLPFPVMYLTVPAIRRRHQ